MKRSILLVLGFVALAVATAFAIGNGEKEKEACAADSACASSSACTSMDKTNAMVSSVVYDADGEEIVLEGYGIGDVATDFSLKNVDGNMVSMADYSDAEGFVIIFTCNHCPYSVAYEDRINDLNTMTSKMGYPVIAINPNNPKTYESDSYENMIIRAEEKNFNFPYLEDKGQKIYPQYGATKTPHVYILKKEDKGPVVKYIGAIDDNYADEAEVKEKYVENAVSALAQGKEVKTKVTKAIGCSIKK